MARSRSRSSRKGGAAKKPARTASSRKKAPTTTNVEVVEEDSGMGTDAGIAIATFMMLLAAILFVDYYWGQSLGGGFFFKG